LNNNSILDYRVTSVSSPDVYSGALPADDPTLNLQVNKRYAFTVVNASAHPFQVIAKGATAAEDVVLLSQGPMAGSMESDPGITWTDDGQSTNGVVEFTVTEALVQQMNAGGRVPGYRCLVHASLMRGNFTIIPAPTEGSPEGIPEGSVEGSPEGTPEGSPEGIPEGSVEGSPEGTPEGKPRGDS